MKSTRIAQYKTIILFNNEPVIQRVYIINNRKYMYICRHNVIIIVEPLILQEFYRKREYHMEYAVEELSLNNVSAALLYLKPSLYWTLLLLLQVEVVLHQVHVLSTLQYGLHLVYHTRCSALLGMRTYCSMNAVLMLEYYCSSVQCVSAFGVHVACASCASCACSCIPPPSLYSVTAEKLKCKI